MEREYEQEPDADADGAISDVEGRETGLLTVAADYIKAEKVDNVTDADSIQQIAENAAKDEAQGKLAAQRVDIKVMTVRNRMTKAASAVAARIARR